MAKDVGGKDEVMTGKTDVPKKQNIKTNRRWNDSYIQKGEVCNLD